VQQERRVWVLPAVLAVIVLSVPAQFMFATRHGEPYPGLFQPRFEGISQTDDRVVRFTAVRLSADGRHLDPTAAFPAGKDELLSSTFPQHGDHARMDDATRRSIRKAVARALGSDPHELTVTWEHRRFHLDTGKITRGKPQASYRVNLREAIR
jgi:hypothetical protein